MAGADNNTRTSRIKAIGVFVGIALLLGGLTAGALYAAHRRSGQLASSSQVAQQNAGNKAQQEQKQSQPPAKSDDKKDQGGAGTQQAPQGNSAAPQSGSTQPQPAPQPQQQQSQPQQAPSQPVAPSRPQNVPATGPEEDMAFVARVGMLAVVAYGATVWFNSRKIRI